MKILKLISFVLLSAVPLSLISCGGGGDESVEAPDFEMTVKVKELGEKIFVEVLEDEYNSGDFLVIYSDETKIFNSRGEACAFSDISVGDTLKIHYGGQVMMSYPPQIYARSITVVKN